MSKTKSAKIRLGILAIYLSIISAAQAGSPAAPQTSPPVQPKGNTSYAKVAGICVAGVAGTGLAIVGGALESFVSVAAFPVLNTPPRPDCPGKYGCFSKYMNEGWETMRDAAENHLGDSSSCGQAVSALDFKRLETPPRGEKAPSATVGATIAE